MKAFVTGGTGFLGTHLVNALLAGGHDVTCLVRSPAKAIALASRRVRIVRGDLEDIAALRDGCREAEVIFHLAGRLAAPSASDFMTANRDGTANVLEAAAEQPSPRALRRFVFMSSLGAAGPTLPGQPIDETRAPHPVTPYGQSKLAGEVLVRNAPFPWTIVRPPLVYGEWDRATLDIFRFASRGLVPLPGSGSQEVSAIHGEDVAGALLAIAATERTANHVYFTAHPQVTTTRALALAVGRAVGRTPRLLPVPAPLVRGVAWVVGSIARVAGRAAVLSSERVEEFLAPAWTCRTDALRADAGWEARIDLDAGLRRTAAWYRQEGWLA